MIILYYLYLLLPFAALFALGYFPIVLLARQWAGGRPVGGPDLFAPVTGAAGTAVGFLFVSLNEFDRFALAPDRVRAAWMHSGLAFPYELAQSLFSGVVCAVVLLLIARFGPSACQRARITSPVMALLISIVDFSFWPVLCSPFIY
jgi:hypothetical protein